jgi:hypothetical protein
MPAPRKYPDELCERAVEAILEIRQRPTWDPPAPAKITKIS